MIRLLLAAAVGGLLGAASPAVSGQSPCDRERLLHTVRLGETLWRIARVYGSSVEELRRSNNITNPRHLRPGDTLHVEPQPRRATASWYGPGFHGRPMANGEVFNMHDHVLAAHKHLPLGTLVLVRHGGSGRALIVRIADRGPYVDGREFDLSRAAARYLGFEKEGTAKLIYRVLSPTCARLLAGLFLYWRRRASEIQKRGTSFCISEPSPPERLFSRAGSLYMHAYILHSFENRSNTLRFCRYTAVTL